ncbi:GNAT family N-acetyltransferase [Nonomuraea sp. LPB2021202275-12-8]|uniref:GNAT family N-acetyltransferase n=1 Tax=Nonomuraea sp. LPB2021202275-12-8 TaxID=3120159 RepID=UPI00300DA275
MRSELARALAFQQGFARRRSPHAVDVPGGFAVLDDRYPYSYDDNKLIVWDAADPAAVLEAADEVLAERGHRLVNVDSDELGVAFAPAFAAAGYQHAENVVMAFRGDPPAGPPEAEHLDLPALLPVLRRDWRADLPEAGEQTIEQLAARVETRLRGADLVGFRGVRAPDGELAARADLYVHDGVAQIEDVYTTTRHRGRGHARTLMRSLLAEAAGSEPIFLVADAADWPREFYGRLGFAEVGRTHSFLRV